MEGLIGRGRCITPLDLLVGPGLAGLWPRRLGILLALLGPGDGEAGVEDPPGIEGGRGGVDRGEGCNRFEVGRVELGGEELADGAVGNAEHPDLVAQTHGWWAMVSITS